ncbi:lytic murein transglycosylase [Actinoplanes sp. NPDC023936]|uniref:lytic transglycosylase domain-containing protein n=1 Tax=Actinoplanes sp. NPDC023936 TaxID=3154910 RepID=UPI0033D2E5B3
MAEAPKKPAERFELRSAAPRQRGPLSGSGAAPGDKSENFGGAPEVSAMPQVGAIPAGGATAQNASAGAGTEGLTKPPTAPKTDAASKDDSDKPGSDSPAKIEPTKPEPGKADAAKADAAKTEAEKAGPAGADAAKADAAKAETGKADAGKADATTGDKSDKADKGAKDDKAGAESASGKSEPATAVAAAASPGVGRRSLRAAGRAGRATALWAKGPSGRVVIPGFVIVALVILAGTSGAYLVPKALEAGPAPSANVSAMPGDPAAGTGLPADGGAGLPGAGATGLPGAGATGLPGAGATGLPGAGATGLPGAGATGLPGAGATGLPGATTGLPATGLPGAGLPGAGLPTTQPGTGGGRPADALSSWATQVGTKVGIPVVAVQAYGYAELVAAKTTPSCHLSWTTLAALAKVESDHGAFNGAVLGVDGVASPTIYGLPLNGQGGRQMIADTDQGQLDGDTTHDRAIGPMQFIPSTWKENAVDADRDGVTNPNDIDDAALTAAVYLCKGGRDLAKAESWWDAILSYNAVRPYAQRVFQYADDYGRRSQS